MAWHDRVEVFVISKSEYDGVIKDFQVRCRRSLIIIITHVHIVRKYILTASITSRKIQHIEGFDIMLIYSLHIESTTNYRLRELIVLPPSITNVRRVLCETDHTRFPVYTLSSLTTVVIRRSYYTRHDSCSSTVMY